MVYLIAGLGNPGKAYEGTRHNVGFEIVEELGKKHGLSFRKKAALQGGVAKGKIAGQDVVLLMPLTFMNLSGTSIAAAIRFYAIELDHFLVVADDVAIPLGELRLRFQGSSGGHNGLESVKEHLQTIRYARLRIGVGDREKGDLTDHVLGKFSQEEKKLLPEVLEKAVRAIEIWLEQGINHAMNFANRAGPGSSNPSKEKNE